MSAGDRTEHSAVRDLIPSSRYDLQIETRLKLGPIYLMQTNRPKFFHRRLGSQEKDADDPSRKGTGTILKSVAVATDFFIIAK